MKEALSIQCSRVRRVSRQRAKMTTRLHAVGVGMPISGNSALVAVNLLSRPIKQQADNGRRRSLI